MTAVEQLNRIVSMVAELSRAEGETALAQLAAQFGITETQVAKDIRTLAGLGDGADHDWHLSLSVTQQADRVSITSMGPWRRPLRLTPDEFMALQVALADDPDREAVARKFAAVAPKTAEPPQMAHDLPGSATRVLDTVRQAVLQRRKLEILYTGSRDRTGRQRIVRPHDLVVHGGRFYCVAWCEAANDWRNFRVDRMLDALLLEATFEPMDGYQPPTTVFHAPDETDEVTVRFSPVIARWLKERYPDGEDATGGAWDVKFDVADPDWLARHVLSFGAEAEVVGPDGYRAVMGRMVG